MEQRDQELVRLLAIDLRGHFKQVVGLYQHCLYTFAYRLTGSFQDAEDIVQECFISAYVSLENYPPHRIQELKLRPWLYKVLLNIYTHHTRKARLHLVSLNLSDDSPELNIEDREEERPEVLFENQECRRELMELLTRLPERYRVAVTCYYLEHLTYQEMADLLDQPVGTVKSTVSRGVRHLRAMLEVAKEGEERKYTWSKIRFSSQKM
ncbi:RNA polymerase sigma factor [Ktedonosporobacter rubrisoli]|uniref:RNA polymerase sigma factor n=1 Tax=Ktedonosporobacter rubrisoli TaxID=2509675 RepID=A0A4P6K423_KTERU|nr:RNA polymerase sigma factor [Ktedonosporobacter rubrisoli]QBD83037.1 RNA polymerase sigma factor [Ktedonosporobacter rubrisoli]